MMRQTLRESISSIVGNYEFHEESRLTITPQKKQELEAEEKQLTYFFRIDQFLNFDANLSGFRTEDYDQQTSWFFYFIDIIYVATIFNISHLITKCGEDTEVYTMAASYFTIMFTTRMFFDTFTSILHANGVLHTMIFILYGLGVYCMTVNIATVTENISLADICSAGPLGTISPSLLSYDSSFGHVHSLFEVNSNAANITSSSGDTTYGSCREAENYSFGFALSFLATRGLIFVLFFLYCTVFHHVKVQSDQNAPRTSNRQDSTASAGNGNSISSRHASHNYGEDDHNSVEMTSPDRSPLSEESDTSKADNNDKYIPPTDAEHKAHVNKVFVWKIVPLIISCFLMLLTFLGFSTLLVFPAVAIVEVVGDVLPELLVNMDGIKADRHNLEERLGLMFMLVLGETMLGFLVQRGNVIIAPKTYNSLM